jgi:hypothetical protein
MNQVNTTTTWICLETATAATTLLAGAVGRDRGHILDTANLDTTTGQSTQGASGTGTRGLGSVATLGAQFDVHSGDVDALKNNNKHTNTQTHLSGGVTSWTLRGVRKQYAEGDTKKKTTTMKKKNHNELIDLAYLKALDHVLSGKHGGVRAALITISLHLHATSHTAEGFATRQIGDVHKGVVEGGVDVRNSEQLLAFAELRAQTDLLDLLLCGGLLLSHD